MVSTQNLSNWVRSAFTIAGSFVNISVSSLKLVLLAGFSSKLVQFPDPMTAEFCPVNPPYFQ